jgi:hypothetical protein
MISLKRTILIATLFAFTASSILNTLPVAAVESTCTISDAKDSTKCLDDFFSGNDILYYDPNAEVCSVTGGTNTTGALSGNDNPEKVFLYFTGKGLTAEQAAGIIANFQQEAYDRIDPAAIQGGAIAPANYIPVHGTGFGIAQWTWNDRQQPLVALSKSSNRDIVDLSLQLDYVWDELNNRYPRALASLKAATTPQSAAVAFHRDFEASADSDAAILAKRAKPADDAFAKYKGLAPSSADNSTDCGANGGSGLTEFMGADFTIFNQCQYPPYGGAWGTQKTLGARTVCTDGCIPTSLAMISKNLAGRNVTPADTASYYSAKGLWAPAVGSFITSVESAAPQFGLRVEKIADKGNIAAYKEVFDKGGLIMAMSAGSSPFMASSHAIVLRGITADGNFMVGDPGQRETNSAPVNQPATDKILTDIRTDGYSASYAFYKQ